METSYNANIRNKEWKRAVPPVSANVDMDRWKAAAAAAKGDHRHE
jgi:hypothetical protein